MQNRLSVWEHRIIRTGLSVLTILGFLAYFFREVWHIVVAPLLHK